MSSGVDLRRLGTAAVLIPVLVFSIYALPPSGFFVLTAAAILAAQYEFYRIGFREPRPALAAVGLAGGLIVAYGFYAGAGAPETGWMTAALAAVLLFQLFRAQPLDHALGETAVAVIGLLYVGWFLGHLILVRGAPRGELIVIFILAVTWMTDTAAYYVGRKVGRRRLAPVVSPNKTVEGAVGGLLGGVATAVVAGVWLLPSIGIGDLMILGGLMALFGQLGDLVESLFKRSAGVKDSGGLIPGHGGFLDKVDSLLFSAPICYYYLVHYKQIGRFWVI